MSRKSEVDRKKEFVMSAAAATLDKLFRCKAHVCIDDPRAIQVDCFLPDGEPITFEITIRELLGSNK